MNLFNLSIEILTILSVFAALAVITSTNPIIAIIFLITLFLLVSIYLILMGLTFIGLSYLLVYIGAITVLFLFIIMMISIEVVQTVEVGSDYSKLLPLAYTLAILFLSLFLILIPSFIAAGIDSSSSLLAEIYNLITSSIYSLLSKLSVIDNSSNHAALLNMNTTYIIPYTIPNTSDTAYYLTTNFDTNLVFKNHINNMFYTNLQIQSIGQSIYGPYSILLILSSFLLLLAMVAPILLSRNEKTTN